MVLLRRPRVVKTDHAEKPCKSELIPSTDGPIGRATPEGDQNHFDQGIVDNNQIATGTVFEKKI